MTKSSAGRFEEMAASLLRESDEATCPACGGAGIPLGGLGTRSHFRCQNCGLDFSKVTNNPSFSSRKKQKTKESLLREENLAANLPTIDRNYRPFDAPNAKLHKELLARGFVRLRLEPPYWYKSPSGLEIAVSSLTHPEQSVTSFSKTWRVSAFYMRRGVILRKFHKKSSKDGLRLIQPLLAFVDSYLPSLLDEAVLTEDESVASDSTGKPISVGDRVVYSRTFLRSTGMLAGDAAQDIGLVKKITPFSAGRYLVGVDFDISGSLKVLSVNLTGKDNIRFEPR